MWKRIVSMAVMLLCVFSLLAGKSVVLAESSPQVDSFSGSVGLLKQENGNYVIQVTVENTGEDFSGIVQVIFAGSNYNNCAYNTEITLPAQGKKQFTITVTERAMDTVRGICALNFIDEKGNLLQSILQKDVLGSTIASISVGILSDQYSGLTFLDAGGRNFRVQGGDYPLELVELNKDNIEKELGKLYFLVIDQFNMSELNEEGIQAIQDWVRNGGWLMIGTGAYARETLSGFEEDFIDIDVQNISEPGEENVVSINVDKRGYYYSYQDAGIDFTQMAIADLDCVNIDGGFYESSEYPAICGTIGDGAVTILSFSLGEKELLKLENYMVQNMYEELMYNSASYQYDNYSEIESVGGRALAFIDSNNTDIDFAWLEILIGFYVVLIGPILYLILCKCKKREWYWICVPVLGLVFIGGVFFFGQGAKVNETRVYSVTAQRVDSNRADTYFLAYHSGVKPWNMRLNENYEVAGPGWDGYGYRHYNSSTSDYFYSVDYDNEGLWVGIKPQENFESGYLYAGKRAESKGAIFGRSLKISSTIGNVSGTVTNDTICDMAYMAVYFNSYIMVFSDVKTGETIDLQQAVQDKRCVYQDAVPYYDRLLFNMVYIYGTHKTLPYEQDDMAALLIGLGIAEGAKPADKEYASIVGVVKDYDKAVASECNEISYGCLYSYVEMEVEENAAN